MRTLLRDVSHFGRMLAKSPGFFAIAVLTLALGIGANTAIFSVINAVLLRPLPFAEPDSLVRLFETEAAPGLYPFAAPDYLDWQAGNRTLDGMALYAGPSRFNVSGAGEPQSALTARVEADFFRVLGVQPLAGRMFADGEDAEGRNRVAVLSHGFWQRQFAGDPMVVSKTIRLNAETYTVVGVMPASANYPRNTEIWIPLDMAVQNLGPRGSHSYQAIGRLKPGTSVEAAQADLAVIAARLEKEYPDSNEKVGAAVVSMGEILTRNAREPLWILLGAVALVLLVACANVANLLLIRAGARRREIAVRLARGAGRGRVIRQLLTESVLLAAAGAAAGLLVAWWCLRLLESGAVLPTPPSGPVTMDLTVLAFTMAAAVVTGLLFGIAPAFQATDLSLSEELKAAGRTVLGFGRRGGRLRDAIVVAEIAMSIALLVAAGLLLRSFDRMQRAEIGVETRNVLITGINLPETVYATPAAQRQFFDRLTESLRTTPGIEAASASTVIPLEGGSNGYITVPGRDDSALKNQLFEYNYVGADYFRVFRIPVVQGRTFSPQDDDHAMEVAARIVELRGVPNPPDALKGLSRVAVINRTMAAFVWPGQDPVGRTFVVGGQLPVTVVGVVGDVSVRGVRRGNLPQAYFAFSGALTRSFPRQLAVKAVVPPMTLLASVRQRVQALDPALALIQPRTMEDVVADGMADTSVQAWLLGVFAALAVLLASVGLYSVMAFLVAQRTHEIGVRIALGAGRGDLMRLVYRHGVRLIVIGIIAGVGGALGLTRLLRSLLYGVASNDPATFVLASLLLALVALAACGLPAWRAMRVSPITALHYE